jgi:hypothetical protein
MLRRSLFQILIILSICSALSASGQEDGFTEMTVAEEVIAEEAQGSVGDSANGTTLAEPLSEGEEVVVAEVEVNGVEGKSDEPPAVLPEGPVAEAPCPMTVIPAAEDIYANLERGMVYNDDHLISEYSMGGELEEDDYTTVAMIQFDISDLEMVEDDVGVLVLKVESTETFGEGATGVVLMPITSEWSENSSASALELNLLAAILMMASGDELDFSQFGMNFGSDEVFAFDVSDQLKAAEGGRVSFLLMAMGDSDCKISFKSRETGEGPSLLIVPYPSEAPSDAAAA